MKGDRLALGFIPLVDAAPLIVAHEMGFAAEEGLLFDLHRAPSWSALRDMLSFGHLDAAHMLAPVPVAAAMGLGGGGAQLDVLSVLSMNGNVIGISNTLAEQLHDYGHSFDFQNAHAAGQALIAVCQKPLRIGVPFPFSMHAELVCYWLTALGLPAPENLDIRTIPPQLMVDAMKASEIDAFCVGEPWGSKVVASGFGTLLLPCNAIWAFAPEKVLTVRHDWIKPNTELNHRLIRATWRARRWLAQPESAMLTAELLSRPEYLNVDAEIIECALSGQFTISEQGDQKSVPGFVEFHEGAAGFPWRSQAEWIAHQLARRTGRDPQDAAKRAQSVFRTDLHRDALHGTTANLPGASSKREGALSDDSEAPSQRGRVVLQRDAFFDGRIFEPLAADPHKILAK
ncbi:MAG: CmpA/NrtA family ABC transporter substrate-binding protein [Paracoccaceae bacterium]